jgi:hypothetical protein
MTNDLTGDFDVVAEFAVPAMNRLLAAMHRNERFPNSKALYVDDTAPSGPPRGSVVAVVDGFGDPIVNHNRIGPVRPMGGAPAASDPVLAAMRPVVNTGVLVATEGPFVPSLLKGRLQVQLAAPTLELPAGAPAMMTARFAVRARYFPDSGTSPLAEFVRGEVLLTTSVKQVTSQMASVIDVDLKGSDVAVAFNPTWSSSPLSAEDVAGVVQLIKNMLKNSVLPSSATLPPTIQSLQLKSLPGPPGAVAVLIQVARPPPSTSGPADPASVQGVFLGAGDGFALAVGSDFLMAVFQPLIHALLSEPLGPVTIPINLFFVTLHATYTVTLNQASIALQPGKIELTVLGHAHAASIGPSFDFTALQDFTLQASGDSADLVVGNLSVDTSDLVAKAFTGAAVNAIQPLRDQLLAKTGVQQTVRNMLSANQALGPFIASLLSPARPNRAGEGVATIGPAAVSAARSALSFNLGYASVEILSSGVVLHGSFDVVDFPAPSAEFEPIPSTGGRGVLGQTSDLFSHGPDYTAFKSWIPGGAVDQYEWAPQGQTPPFVDPNRFVLLASGPVATDAPAAAASAGVATANPAVSPYSPMCLTVRGSRLSSSGPFVVEPVSATVCAYSVVSVLGQATAASAAAAPLIALTRAGAGGMVEVTGHAAATADPTGQGPPNLVVHFGNNTAPEELTLVMKAVEPTRGGRAVTGVLAVIPPDVLPRTRRVAGVLYSDEQGGAWERLFQVAVHRRPLTLIVTKEGKVAWRHEGRLDGHALAAALQKHLVPGTRVGLPASRLTLHYGLPPPDFLIPPKSRTEPLITLRKLGVAADLVFWCSKSRPSLDAVCDAEAAAGRAAGRKTVLAVNVGEPDDLAQKVAAEHFRSAVLVTDPRRAISEAYRVAIYPTRVCVDAAGLVSAVQYGRETGDKGHV